MSVIPSLSTDQMAALVELARQGSLRAAAEVLYLSEQGVRSRLIALESRLGVELYRKRRGIRRSAPLTQEGERFLPHAVAFLESAGELTELFRESAEPREVRVVASQYLIAYALIDVVRRFHASEPAIRIRLSARTEEEIDEALREDPQITLGVAAPYEVSTELEYRHWFSMDWSIITPQRHPLLKNKRLRLADIAAQPLIIYERGSTGRSHVLDAFHKGRLSPRIHCSYGRGRPGNIDCSTAPVRSRDPWPARRHPQCEAFCPADRLRHPGSQRRAAIERGTEIH
jgi:DNA-binding transcriptional LysR family regulator